MDKDHFKHKQAKNWACGICSKFVRSAEYFAMLAEEIGVHDLTINLLEPDVSPKLFDEARNLSLVWYCSNGLLSNFSRGEYPKIRSALMDVSFTIKATERYCSAKLAIEFEDGVCVDGSFYDDVVYLKRR